MHKSYHRISVIKVSTEVFVLLVGKYGQDFNNEEGVVVNILSECEIQSSLPVVD